MRSGKSDEAELGADEACGDPGCVVVRLGARASGPLADLRCIHVRQSSDHNGQRVSDDLSVLGKQLQAFFLSLHEQKLVERVLMRE